MLSRSNSNQIFKLNIKKKKCFLPFIRILYKHISIAALFIIIVTAIKRYPKFAVLTFLMWCLQIRFHQLTYLILLVTTHLYFYLLRDYWKTLQSKPGSRILKTLYHPVDFYWHYWLKAYIYSITGLKHINIVFYWIPTKIWYFMKYLDI